MPTLMRLEKVRSNRRRELLEKVYVSIIRIFTMKMKFALVFLAGLIMISGCGILGSKDPLNGTKWQLQTIGDAEPIASSVVTIEFSDQRMSGSAGCNSYGAGYQIDGKLILFDAVAMTEMACADELVMQQEGDFTRLLDQVDSFKYSNEVLEFVDAEGKTIMTFIPRP